MALTQPTVGRRGLAALFLVSAASVGFEIALTRYFAVATWSEYGYWVISIVLAGFALSGVAMALARDWFARHGPVLLAWLPAALLATAAAGFHFVTTNPFNPLQLQNPVTVVPQLWDIAGYYACLLPFFFLTGLFVSLNFVLGGPRTGLVYGCDLTGAGAGALLVLALMWVVHPFRLVIWLLPPIALAALLTPRRRVALAVALLALLGGEALLVLDDRAAINDFKPIYAPMHVPDTRMLAERRTPRGLYDLLDDFTERVDTDVSNDAAMLGLPGPPRTFGLYRDGIRIGALPMPGPVDMGYAKATLAALPYALLGHPRVLLVGASGGFRPAEALALGAAHVDAAEPEPVLRAAIRRGLGGAPAMPADPRVRLTGANPMALVRDGQHYDLIDIAGDFVDAAEANVGALTAEAIAADLRATRPDGLVSIPVSIRDFPAYASRALATVRAALVLTGAADPAAHVIVYRSAWNVRILVSAAPMTPRRVAAARAWCDERSFDVSYYPGIDVAAARAGIYNDLPAVSFEQGAVTSAGQGAHDAVADEAGPVLRGETVPSARSFDLRPITLNRPAYYAVLRLSDLGTLLRRLELLPQAEVGALVNLAVLAQAAVIALVVLLVPLLAGRRVRLPGGGTARAVLYFACLGLGYLFVEIFAIERASFYLDDRTTAFALVLTSMLVCSGLGSLLADRLRGPSGSGPWTGRRPLLLACGAVALWCGALALAGEPAMLAALDWPAPLRALAVFAVVAPVGLALGLPFPLGLARAGQGGFLPWAWGINGAFSVVATPLANLVARLQGLDRVLQAALLLYVLAAVSFPASQKRSS